MKLPIHLMFHAARRRPASNGFTIIETLIAVALLMIAIAGPMVVATQALTAAVGARNVLIATNLAQEGMEYLKNIKDNNTNNGATTWLVNIDNGNSATTSSLGAGSGTCVRPNSASSISCYTPDPAHTSVYTSACSGTCGPFIVSNTGYQWNQAGAVGTSTPFIRYFYITPVPLAGGGYDQNQAVFTVVVSWLQASVPNQITLQELMTNSRR